LGGRILARLRQKNIQIFSDGKKAIRPLNWPAEPAHGAKKGVRTYVRTPFDPTHVESVGFDAPRNGQAPIGQLTPVPRNPQ
jgi:hypothetical protein